MHVVVSLIAGGHKGVLPAAAAEYLEHVLSLIVRDISSAPPRPLRRAEVVAPEAWALNASPQLMPAIHPAPAHLPCAACLLSVLVFSVLVSLCIYVITERVL